MKLNQLLLIQLCIAISISSLYPQGGPGTFTLENKSIVAEISRSGIRSITSPDDPYKANVVSSTWSRPSMTYKILDGDWLDIGSPERLERALMLANDGFWRKSYKR